MAESLVERIARTLAARHYAKRFDKPETDEHVLMNVKGNWQIFAGQVREVIELMRSMPELQPLIGEDSDADRWKWNCQMCGGPRENWELAIDAALKGEAR